MAKEISETIWVNEKPKRKNVSTLEKLNEKKIKSSFSVIFTKRCLKGSLLPKYTLKGEYENIYFTSLNLDHQRMLIHHLWQKERDKN